MSRGVAGACCLVIAGVLAGSQAVATGQGAAAPMPAPAALRQLAPSDLDVTLGQLAEVDGRLLVESARFRAVARQPTAQLAELDFTYLGPTAAAAPLASGELRRQLGLKLRAEDGCNLVYVMWRLAPRQQLVVSIKRNRGATRHAQCGAGGYRNVRPLRQGPLPPLAPGGSHSLRAELDGERLVVLVDGGPAWEGSLGQDILAFDGPVGLRTDNVRVAFRFRAP